MQWFTLHIGKKKKKKAKEWEIHIQFWIKYNNIEFGKMPVVLTAEVHGAEV